MDGEVGFLGEKRRLNGELRVSLHTAQWASIDGSGLPRVMSRSRIAPFISARAAGAVVEMSVLMRGYSGNDTTQAIADSHRGFRDCQEVSLARPLLADLADSICLEAASS